MNVIPGKPSIPYENGDTDIESLCQNRQPKVEILLVDEGTKRWENLIQLRTIKSEYLQLPRMAIETTLSGIKLEINRNEDMKRFVDFLSTVENLYLCIDKKAINRNPAEVILYSEHDYKTVNLNALLVWKGMAKLTDEFSPFFYRIEYFKGT